jgi:hypothetical protein
MRPRVTRDHAQINMVVTRPPSDIAGKLIMLAQVPFFDAADRRRLRNTLYFLWYETAYQAIQVRCCDNLALGTPLALDVPTHCKLWHCLHSAHSIALMEGTCARLCLVDTHTHTRAHTRTHTHTHTHTHARTHARTHTHAHACMHAHREPSPTRLA